MTWKLAVIVATLATAATVSTQVLSTPKATSGEKGLTQVAGLKVGHVTLSERPTGWVPSGAVTMATASSSMAPVQWAASLNVAPHPARAKPTCSIH